MSYTKTADRPIKSSPCIVCDRVFYTVRKNYITIPAGNPVCPPCGRIANAKLWGTRTMAFPIGVGGMMDRRTPVEKD
jgi:hypothetical protein